MLNSDDRIWLSRDKEVAMVAIVLVVVITVGGTVVLCWKDSASAVNLITLIVTNALTCIGTMVTGKKD